MNGQTPGRIDLWLRRLMRYGLGGGGLTWAIVTNHLNPVIWMVLGAIATSTDIFLVARGLLKAAREEGRWLEQEHARLQQEHARLQQEQERETPPSPPAPPAP